MLHALLAAASLSVSVKLTPDNFDAEVSGPVEAMMRRREALRPCPIHHACHCISSRVRARSRTRTTGLQTEAPSICQLWIL